MLRFLRILFLAILGIALLAVAAANLGPVTFYALPKDMAAVLGIDSQIKLPLFLFIFAGILVGLGIGFVWEWFREAKHRSALAEHKREAGQLRREVSKLKTVARKPDDDVLALLEGDGAAR
jgi:lipopolysaccharide assembly protein A